MEGNFGLKVKGRASTEDDFNGLLSGCVTKPKKPRCHLSETSKVSSINCQIVVKGTVSQKPILRGSVAGCRL